MKLKGHVLIFVLALMASVNDMLLAGRVVDTDSIQHIIHVPLGGNSWVSGGGKGEITKNGLINWGDPGAIIDTYVRFAKPGKVKLSLKAIVEGKSKVRITVAGRSKAFSLKSSQGEERTYNAGEWTVTRGGYAKISVQGISRAGQVYAIPSGWILEGVAVNAQTTFVRDNQGNYFYWGRRGPSVHLNYTLPAGEDIEWFYNEVTVPEKDDVIGSYFMANGFGEGYFGMQVNSEKERRILFSVWSPFQTDDPKSIPEDKRITLLRKGDGVYTGEFGNEGSGGQSYMKYDWKAGTTYRFLLNGRPSGDSATTYTAYFFAPEKNKWQIIASFKRPKTQTYLKRLHSFLENFIPETGYIGRQANFGNQWVRNAAGKWTELTVAKFTADATARQRYRMDYAGGKLKNQFFLRNCGFFNEYTPINEVFERTATGVMPALDLEAITRLSANTAGQP